MNPIFILSAMAALGIEVGWEPLSEGGHEYTIQIEPQLLEVLRQGREIVSEVPPQLNVRRYRVTVGTQKLAQIDGEPQGTPEPNQPERQRPERAANPFTTPAEPVAVEHAPDTPLPEGSTFSGHEPIAVEPPANRGNHKAGPPGILPAISSGSKPIENRPAAHQEPENVDTKKPALPAAHTSASSHAAEPSRPWVPLLIAIVLLCCSLGVNAYLGWIAWDARRGHRDALAKFRAAGVS
jgi:hypothetical protein